MKRTLLVSKRAETDLLEIWIWTNEQFGEAQADRYLDALETGMRRCGSEPQSGQDRGTIRAGYRSWRAGMHAIFYTCTDSEVVIQRVLHSSMDFESHLPSQ